MTVNKSNDGKEFSSRIENSKSLDIKVNLAAEALFAGNLVAFPTETVYGLGADASNYLAVKKIYKTKGRPTDHPLIVHVADYKYLDYWISEIPKFGIDLARSFWPGPMTLILKRSKCAEDFITGSQDSVGIRIPNNLSALALLEAFHNLGGFGVAAPSANRFGQVSPTTALAVQEEIGLYLSDSDLILDGGSCEIGLESTIIDCTSEVPRVLRPGSITIEMINQVTGLEVSGKNDHYLSSGKIRVSGSLVNHYSPKARVILDKQPTQGCGFLALAGIATPEGVIRLASPESVSGFAQVLYSALREGDRLNLKEIYVSQPAGEGLALAIRDRLIRAASVK